MRVEGFWILGAFEANQVGVPAIKLVLVQSPRPMAPILAKMGHLT